MAVTVSGMFLTTWKNMINGTSYSGGPINLTLATYKIALLGTGATPNFSSNHGWADLSANEVSGTGWAAGGVLLSAAASGATSTAPTVSESPTGTIMYDMNDVSVASTTLTNAVAAVIYADPITAPTADPMIVCVYFGSSSGYSTAGGTFGISWSTAGVIALDITP